MSSSPQINHKVREEALYASIRKTVQNRDEILSYKDTVDEAIPEKLGDLVVIYHYDTPVKGFDAEIGYFVDEEINTDIISTRKYLLNEFLTLSHYGSIKDISKSVSKIYKFMYEQGISAGMELIEVYHKVNEADDDFVVTIEASMHMWLRLYRINLEKILGNELTNIIWKGGEHITPLINIEDRVLWVTNSLSKLKKHSDEKQQFEIISRIALTRPKEETGLFKELFKETGDINLVMEKRVGSQFWVSEPRIEGNMIITSKTPRRKDLYQEAITFDEMRNHYCHCILVAMSKSPKIDPIFCYRAAGWARQLWEDVLEKPVISCSIHKSMLKGDEYCEFALEFETIP